MTAAQAKPETEAPKVSEAPLTLLQRLNAVMRDVTYVQKDKKIDVGRGYMVVTHDAVTAKVRPALVKHGVFYYPFSLQHKQEGNRTEVYMVVRFVNVDDRDDFIDVPCLGYGIDPGDKGPGKAASYAVKYALLKALGLETGEDADNEASPDVPEPQGEKSPRGPRGAMDKKPPDENGLKLYGYPGQKGPETVNYKRTSKDLVRWIDDMEVACRHNPTVWDTNSNMIDIVLEGIAAMERKGLPEAHDMRRRMQDMESLMGDAKFLQAG